METYKILPSKEILNLTTFFPAVSTAIEFKLGTDGLLTCAYVGRNWRYHTVSFHSGRARRCL